MHRDIKEAFHSFTGSEKADPKKDEKRNYSPPGWIVSHFDQVRLDPKRAEAFDAFRKRLCNAADPENQNHIEYPFLHHNELWMMALDLLLGKEEELLEVIKRIQNDER